MKKVLALVAVAFLCTAVVALAGDEKKMGAGKSNEGTITKIDTAGKMMTVKNAEGKEDTVYWTDTTKVEGGELKEGSKVHWKGTEKDGKMTATWIHAGEMKHGKM